MLVIKVYTTAKVDPLVEHHEAEVAKQCHQEDDLRNELEHDADVLPEEPLGVRNYVRKNYWCWWQVGRV